MKSPVVGSVTYKNLEPGPYCPDTGQAQTTWTISKVPLGASDCCTNFEVNCWSDRIACNVNGEGRAGINDPYGVGSNVGIACEGTAAGK